MRFFTFRLNEIPKNNLNIKLYPVPLVLENGDKFLVFIQGSMEVLGLYEKKDDQFLILEKQIEGKVMSDMYEFFDEITEINDRTYKLFAKPAREWNIETYEKIKNH